MHERCSLARQMLIYDSIVCKQQDGKTLVKRIMFVKKDYTRMKFCNEGAQHRNSRGSCEPAENLCRHTSFLSTTPPRKSRGWGVASLFKGVQKKDRFFFKKKGVPSPVSSRDVGGIGVLRCEGICICIYLIIISFLFFFFLLPLLLEKEWNKGAGV